ncbi:hypothetical protein CEXT_406931 [Caerostris extrusa]|uniref:Uncharacterized protein n=1 Tax=Caerostris extrusa TaxID=172846 RepID=A0AAV4XYC4_CAEEX|nr:hypothetical protein CEXT_406931 [Caerostris extrusa]
MGAARQMRAKVEHDLRSFRRLLSLICRDVGFLSFFPGSGLPGWLVLQPSGYGLMETSGQQPIHPASSPTPDGRRHAFPAYLATISGSLNCDPAREQTPPWAQRGDPVIIGHVTATCRRETVVADLRVPRIYSTHSGLLMFTDLAEGKHT